MMTLGAVLMLISGIAAVLAGNAGAPAVPAHAIDHEGSVIEILPGKLGFNPEVCQVNRNGGTARFYNTDTVPRRVVRPDPYNPDPTTPSYLFDSGWIQPGSYGGTILATAPHEFTYQDYDDESLTGVFQAPLSNNAPTVCSPLSPTPTPTNTPTITPTPFATPTATPTMPPSIHPRCYGSIGCAVAPEIAADGE